MAFLVYLTEDASRDLEELYDYIASHDAPGNAVAERSVPLRQSASVAVVGT